ncbi:MAG: penicillin-binding protein activator LpoB, partial [Nitrospirae bacterium]|nr:penicillin-binding protein activator LpoB [Nitrospirota bacterium]
MNKLTIILVICLGLVIGGCSSGPSVKRVSTDEVIDLSGKWNDTDSRFVSEAMIHDSLSRPWLGDFKSSHKGKRPVVIVGTVRNMSHEHINVQTFTKDLERALINSGDVDFVASRKEDKEIREERKQQSQYSSEETAKAEGQEIGADFILQGGINTILDKIEGREVMFYQVNLELIEIAT